MYRHLAIQVGERNLMDQPKMHNQVRVDYSIVLGYATSLRLCILNMCVLQSILANENRKANICKVFNTLCYQDLQIVVYVTNYQVL